MKLSELSGVLNNHGSPHTDKKVVAGFFQNIYVCRWENYPYEGA